jgi:hypothetical protein
VRKEKVAFVYGMKAYRVIRGIAFHILTLAVDGLSWRREKSHAPV